MIGFRSDGKRFLLITACALSAGFFLPDYLLAAPTPRQEAPVSTESLPPQELLVCENDGPCDAAWIFSGVTGKGTWYGKDLVRANLTVLRAEPDYISIRRTDLKGGRSATYAGSLHGDHFAGTIIWSSPDHPGQSTGTWTASVPQTNCSAQPGLTAEDAMRLGQYALMFRRDADVMGCYTVAAQAGDATAQAVVGLIYYQGRGATTQDYSQAFFWLHKAADQGVYAAERSVAEMYSAGLGTRKDAALAQIYTARADEQKHDLERREDAEERAEARREEHAEREADRFNNIVSNFVLGASFGIFF